jgi:hypothetical protein
MHSSPPLPLVSIITPNFNGERFISLAEPIIGHLKSAEGDALHAVLCAAGYNIRWLLRMIVKKGLGLLLRLLQVSDLTGLYAKLAEIFGRNRLQSSSQRWALA